MIVALLIALAGPDGQTIWLNPEAVISIREPRGLNSGHWPAHTRCLIMTIDSKFVTTVESCGDVRRKLEKRE